MKRINIFLIDAMLFLALVWSVIFLSDGAVDTICIEGRLSEAQAQAINQTEWDKCPKYRNGNCQAEKEDRVLARECSEFSKKVFGDWLR